MSVAAVVSVLALAVSGFAYLQAGSPSEERLSVAAVTLGDPVDLSGTYIEANGEVSTTPLADVVAAPIDVTLKNDGGSVASITSVTATIIKSEHVLSCRSQGAGGIAVAAEYALRLPRSQLLDGGAVDPVSSDIDFKVDPGKTARLAVTVGPDSQAENAVVLVALRLTFGLDDGSTVDTEPIIIGTTQDIIGEFVAEAEGLDPTEERVANLCKRELAKIDDVASVGGVIAEPVQELRAAYQRLA